jgi:DNA-binding transcriptional MerR regulator
MSVYSIKDLERISNQKAHTIRIWEHRYGLLQPQRTETNIRYYDDTQLKKLLNVCTLIQRGMKISAISKLSNQEIAEQINLILSDAQQGDVYIEGVISEILIAIATYDAVVFNRLFEGAVEKLGLQKTYVKVIYPLLVRAGLMWSQDDLLPSQEHFFSNLIRQKLFSAIDALSVPDNADQTWVLFLYEEEDHEIGLLFAYYIITHYNKKVIYLGARVPYENLSDVISVCKPTHIYTFFVKNAPHAEQQRLLNQLTTDFTDCCICLSGGDPDLPAMQEKNVLHISTVDSLTDLLK